MSVATITPNWLGDLVMSADAVKFLKDSLGDEPLHVYAPGHLAAIAELILPADEVIPFRLGKRLARLRDRLTLAGRMRSRRYRAVVLFPNSFSTALVARMSGAPQRVGTPMHSRGRLLTRPVDPPRPGEHEGDAYVRVAAAAVGVKGPLPPVGVAAGLAAGEELSVPDQAREKASDLLQRRGLDTERERFVAISPGAAYGPAKQYGAERFALVARDAAARGLRPVIVGARGDVDVARDVAERAAGCSPLDLAGKTDLAELAGVFALASAFAGTDSGAAHLAAALATPTVALFLSTKPVRTSPRGARVKVLAADVECRPCMKRSCPRGTYECREAIAPGEIVRALGELGAF